MSLRVDFTFPGQMMIMDNVSTTFTEIIICLYHICLSNHFYGFFSNNPGQLVNLIVHRSRLGDNLQPATKSTLFNEG